MISNSRIFKAIPLSVFLMLSANVFAQEACVVKGNTLSEARNNYTANCQTSRIDCDPINGVWYCASFSLNSTVAPTLTQSTSPNATNTGTTEQTNEQAPTVSPAVTPQDSTPVPIEAPQQVPTSTAPDFPTCTNSSYDSDGDGYGWENNATCLVELSADTAIIATPDSTETSVPTTTNAATNEFISTGLGRWGNPISLPSIPVSAANLPNGKVLTWAAYNPFMFEYGSDYRKTYTTIFDPSNGTVSESLVANTSHDMFCPGASMLADGSIMVTGGSSVAKTSTFNPATGSWSAQDTLNIPRAYNSNTTLHDGSVMTLGGSWAEEDSCRTGFSSSQSNCSDKSAEVWNSVTGWKVLSGISADALRTNDADGLFRSDNHMWLFTVAENKVLHAGPSKSMHMLNTNGNGGVTAVGNRSNDNDAMNGNAVMYDIGKILTLGGAPDYEKTNATNSAFIINVNGSSVTSNRTDSMKFRRAYHNSVVLPNGEVIVMGGQSYPVPFSDDNSIYAAELWNPVNESFRTLATMSTPRNYHSMALLLQDGKVLVGGGGLCGNCTTNHADVEIFTPPYLLNQNNKLKDRPVILSAPDSSSYGRTVSVQTNKPINSVTLVRMAAVTHSVNNDQRRIPLEFYVSGNNNYSVLIPSDAGIAPPGNYFLFTLDKTGTPSVAKVINIR